MPDTTEHKRPREFEDPDPIPDAGSFVSTMEALQKLRRDLKTSARTLGKDEARFLVDSYYALQQFRISSSHQVRQLTESGEPTEVLMFFGDQFETLEKQIKSALDAYSDGQLVGRWAKSITGIGPVITAGLLAHIDIKQAPTVGHIWRYAGLDPTSVWEKGEKRPWNASLKTLCWKIGESFVKVSGREKDIYGKVYLERKALDQAKNDRLVFKDQAADLLKTKNFRKETIARAAYEKGLLPPGHIHARAKRWAVKLFLAHLHHVWYEIEFEKKPPNPYIIEHGGHTHFIAPPNWAGLTK